jgi:hypothetical protein
MDFRNPYVKGPRFLLPEFSPEMVEYIENEYMPKAPLVERIGWRAWRASRMILGRRGGG